MLGEWNRTLDAAAGRYERAMQASGLFEVAN
jgi:hypothetical protein